MAATLTTMRALGVLLAVATTLVVAAGAAHAQTPTPTATATQGTPTPTPTPTATPTPTVTPTPTPDPQEEKKAKLRKRKVVKRVYRDYRDDGRIDNCRHSRKALKRTLQSISDEFDADFPDFREAVKAAIKDWDKNRCEREAEATPTPTPTPSATATPTPTTTPIPTTPPPSSSGSLPDLGGSDNNNGDNNHGGGVSPPSSSPSPPSEGDVQPVQPTATPTPTPTATPPAEAQLTVTRPHAQDADLAVPGLLLAAALLGLAAAGGSVLYARRTGRLQGWGHAWREASYRASGAWGDFSDWLRLGR